METGLLLNVETASPLGIYLIAVMKFSHCSVAIFSNVSVTRKYGDFF